jgi:hypothetical protein
LERNVDGVVAASISHRRIAEIGAHRYFRTLNLCPNEISTPPSVLLVSLKPVSW